VFPNLTVADNLRVASASGASLARLEEVAYSLFPVLGERRKQLAGTMSGGEMQMLSLARGLGGDPAVLLIDELSMGLAPLVVAELYEAVEAVAAFGIAVLVVEQFATIAMQYAQQVLVMNHGTITFRGRSDAAHDAIHQAYLGVST
jgi:branched-chain amino acid transport system ATP-binding protein